MDVSYDSKFAVTAAWSLSFFPANISVVFFQRCGVNSIHCIGSQSWMFPTFAECIANLSVYPWRASLHLIDEDWTEEFESQGIHTYERVRWPEQQGRTIRLTQSMLGRCAIDTEPRPWEPQGNNQILIDSLADYRLPDRGENEGKDYGLTPMATFEQYLVRAVELYAVWEASNPRESWHPPPSYAATDRAAEVISRGKTGRRYPR